MSLLFPSCCIIVCIYLIRFFHFVTLSFWRVLLLMLSIISLSYSWNCASIFQLRWVTEFQKTLFLMSILGVLWSHLLFDHVCTFFLAMTSCVLVIAISVILFQSLHCMLVRVERMAGKVVAVDLFCALISVTVDLVILCRMHVSKPYGTWWCYFCLPYDDLFDFIHIGWCYLNLACSRCMSVWMK